MVQHHVIGSLHCSFSFADMALEAILPKEEAHLGFSNLTMFLDERRSSGTLFLSFFLRLLLLILS